MLDTDAAEISLKTPAEKAAANAGTALLRALFAHAAAYGSRTVIANDLGDLVALLELEVHEPSAIRRAIRTLHYGGAINCGHPNRDEYKDHPGIGRGYKITLLIKP